MTKNDALEVIRLLEAEIVKIDNNPYLKNDRRAWGEQDGLSKAIHIIIKQFEKIN